VSETDISRKPHKLRNTGSDSQTRYLIGSLSFSPPIKRKHL
jgi:hypothetical protein